MLNVFICENLKEEREYIEKSIIDTINSEHIDLKIAVSTDNPYDILNYIKTNASCGLYFLGTDFQTDINGMELAQKIRRYDPRGFIAFVTSHSELSYLTFLYKIEALDFIIKDTNFNIDSRISECILNAYKKFCFKSPQVLNNFIFKTGDKIINVNIDDILFFETSSAIHKIVIHCKNRQIEFYGKMKDIEHQLDSRFLRCHRSFLINKENIAKIDTENRIAYMKNTESCPVSTRCFKTLQNSRAVPFTGNLNITLPGM